MPTSRHRFPILALGAFAITASAGWLFLAVPGEGADTIHSAAVVDPGADLALEHGAAINSAPVDTASGPRPPGRLVIRSIGVDAPVIGVGVDKTGAMSVTNQSYDVGWYKLGPAPGDNGDAVLDGHLDWYDTSRAVFYNLKNLQIGDDIEVQRLDGASHHFRVTKVESVAYNATVPGLFVQNGPPRLSLITCGGAWSTKLNQYLQRVIVDSTLVN